LSNEIFFGQDCFVKKYAKVNCKSFSFPEYNSLSKASALKVNTALRKFFAPSLKGERQKYLATYPSYLESYRLENDWYKMSSATLISINVVF
jgi:hypothetical protein